MGNIAVVGLDSDGAYGPTDYAGGIADKSTMSRAQEAGIELFECLKTNNVTPIPPPFP